MKYKIVVDKQSRTNPTDERREYEIDIEELRCKGDIYDSLVITKEEDYIIRRLELTKYFVLKELAEPIKQVIPDINIELFEGDNYIYIIDMAGNKFYAEYLVKNEFNDVYATKAEMSSAINQSAREVEISVNEKLTEYSKTEEMNAIIQALSKSILLEVNKKVDGKDFTSAQILLLINNDNTSEAKIKADKISLTGKILNLGDNMAITSTYFKVDKNGKVTVIGTDKNNASFLIKSGSSDVRNLFLSNFCFELGGGSNARASATITDENEILFHLEGASGNDLRYLSSAAKLYFAGGMYIREPGGNTHTTEITNAHVRAPAIVQTSERKQKKNITKLKDALDIIKNVDIYKYNLKKEKKGTKKHIGFVIGDNYNYSKELTNNDNTGAEIYSLASVCLAGIKEQQEQIETLKKEVEQLKEAQNEKSTV